MGESISKKCIVAIKRKVGIVDYRGLTPRQWLVVSLHMGQTVADLHKKTDQKVNVRSR